MSDQNNSSKKYKLSAIFIFWTICALMVFFLCFLIYEHFTEKKTIISETKIQLNIDSTYLLKNPKFSAITILLDSSKFNSTFEKYFKTSDERIQYDLNKNIFHYLTIFAPIILLLFSSIFALFNYFTTQNLNKSEKLLDELNNKSQIFEEFTKDIQEKFLDVTDKIKDFNSDVKNAGINRVETFRQLMVLFNKFLLDEQKVSLEEITRLIELMDSRTALGACYYLQQQGNIKSVPFMMEFKALYDGSKDTNYISDLIETAIRSIILRDNENKKTKTDP
jgi:hypothetical protein